MNWREWMDALERRMYYQGIDTESAMRLAEGLKLCAEAVEIAHMGVHSVCPDCGGRHEHTPDCKVGAAVDFLRSLGREGDA